MEREKSSRGFTLVELLVVMVIIGLIAVLLIVQYRNIKEKARVTKAQTVLNQLHTAFATMEIDTGYWPGREVAKGGPDPQSPGVRCSSDNNEVEDLNDMQTGVTRSHPSYPHWNGPYLSTVPLDPWGNNYFFDTDYTLPGGSDTGAVIGSYGPNGTGNNLYDADDIILVMDTDSC